MSSSQPTSPPRRSYFVLVAAVFAMSLSAIFIRFADAPGVLLALYRMAIAAIILAPVAVRGLRRTPLTRQTIIYTVLAGIFLAVHFATWISSLAYTTVAASVTLVSTTPLWTALFSWIFLGKPPSMTMLFGVLLAVGGGAMIGFGDLAGGSAPVLGDVLALSGAVAMAAYLLLGRAAQKQGLGIGAYAGSAYAVAALVLIPAPALFGISYFDYPLSTFGWIFLLAVIPQLVGHTGVNYVMRFLDPTLVATIILLEPIGAALLAIIFFDEVPSLVTIAGAVVLLAGVALTARFSQSPAPSYSSHRHPDRVR